MRRTFVAFVLGASLALTACATAQIETAHQTSEKAMIAADDLYIAVASFANAQEAGGSWTTAHATDVKRSAWNALQTARAAYKAGEIVSDAALVTIAKENGVKP